MANVDLLTYAAHPDMPNYLESLAPERYSFLKRDISDPELKSWVKSGKFDAIVNFAAETHVDRSIHDSKNFIETNIVGTYHLLESTRNYWINLDERNKNAFRYLHISTDEVYGSLSPTDPAFSETNPYEPNSPYSASKAASDHLVRAWHHTYGLPEIGRAHV